MSIFAKGRETINETFQNPEEFQELCIYQEVASLPEQEIKQFLESAECQVLEEKGILTKKTLVRLNKVDDLQRRTKMAAYQLAKEKNDPLWKALVANRVKERMLIRKIVQKYGNVGARTAKANQRIWLRNRNKSIRPDQAQQTNFRKL